MQIENPFVQYMYSYPHKTSYRTLENVHLGDYCAPLNGGSNSLYMHIPFCQYKCGYCNLFSVTGQPEQRMQDYVDAMERHAVQLSEVLQHSQASQCSLASLHSQASQDSGAEFSDLTLGGGTPLILSEAQLRKVFSIARDILHFQPDTHPIVIETSPNQTTSEKLSILKEEGVNRISIGVQSFHDAELASLYRMHDSASAKRALHAIKEKNFDCLNMDFIYGIPGQTVDSLLDSLKQALEFEPDELFVYPLYVKPGTLLYQKQAKQSADIFAMQKQMREYLRAAGYEPHSMRRFVKGSGHRLPENLCGFGNTISVGCGGRSYVGNLHFCSPYAVKQSHCINIIEDYIAREDYLVIPHGFLLSDEEQKRRYVIKQVLFGRGIDLADYAMHYKDNVLDAFPAIRQWINDGYARNSDGFITLTEEGFLLSDYLGPQLISPAVQALSAEFYKDF